MRLIDADELKKALGITSEDCNKCGWGSYESCGRGKEFEDICIAIDNAVPVDAVSVWHGRWIDIDSETYTWKIRCSKCGHERSMMSTGQTYPMYCEDCGARMDGEGNGNETD